MGASLRRARVFSWAVSLAALAALVAPGAALADPLPSLPAGSGADAAGCLAHLAGDEDATSYYTPGCTGHDEPELDPISKAAHSALDVTWHAVLANDGLAPVSLVGPTFWFGGTVADHNPDKLGGQGFLELQLYPDSFTKRCTDGGGFVVHSMPNVYTACSPVWTLVRKPGGNITEPAAFNAMLTDQAGTGPLVMNGGDTIDVHIWAPSASQPYREHVVDETTGHQSDVIVLIGPDDGPLTPAYDTQQLGNALDWGDVYDTPMAFVWEIGHAFLYGDHSGQFCVPGQRFCDSFNHDSWAGQVPIRILDVTFGDGSHPTHWGVVTDTGGKAEVKGKSFVGPTKCDGYGGPYCIYPWFSWDGSAFNFGVNYPETQDALHKAGQFNQQARCPPNILGDRTYCDDVVR